MKILKLCESYLSGIKDIKNCRKNKKTKTLLAALKVFSYLSIVLPVTAITVLGISRLCGRIHKKQKLSKNDKKVDNQFKIQISDPEGRPHHQSSVLENPSSPFRDFRLKTPRTPKTVEEYENLGPNPLHQLDVFMIDRKKYPHFEIMYVKRVKNPSCQDSLKPGDYLKKTLTAINEEGVTETFPISSIILTKINTRSPGSTKYRSTTDFSVPANHYQIIKQLLETSQDVCVDLILKTTISNPEYLEEKFTHEYYGLKGTVTNNKTPSSFEINLYDIIGVQEAPKKAKTSYFRKIFGIQ